MAITMLTIGINSELPHAFRISIQMDVTSNSRDSYPFLTILDGCPYQLRHVHSCHYSFYGNTLGIHFVESIHFRCGKKVKVFCVLLCIRQCLSHYVGGSVKVGINNCSIATMVQSSLNPAT